MFIEELFAEVFKKLASDPTEQHKQWARELWHDVLTTDTHPSEWNINEALLDLGLARYKGSARSFEYKGYDYDE